MIISSYAHTENGNLYFRITLNNEDKKYIRSQDVKIYQLKCIGATETIFNNVSEFETDNFEFQDRLFPNLYTKHDIIFKAEFGIMMMLKKKRKNSLVIKIDFIGKQKIKIRDAYIFNNTYGVAPESIIPSDANKYKYFAELETIIRRLFNLSSKTNLCASCKYFSEYKKNGYCLNYHPDSKIPQP